MMRVLAAAVRSLWGGFLFLALATPSWRVGPFTWWPVVRLPMLAGEPATFGALALLPLLVVLGWLAWRLLERPRRSWLWGPAVISLPLAGISLLVATSLEPSPSWRTLTQVGSLLLAWLGYLFMVNERPIRTLMGSLALVLLVQGIVAVAQFWSQHSVGLAMVGESPLDLAQMGISVIAGSGGHWLRAYGLTAHPNLLGSMLAVSLLIVLPRMAQARPLELSGLLLVCMTGLLGLLTSFSRGAWLAFALGLVVVAGSRFKWPVRDADGERPVSRSRLLAYGLSLLLVLSFLVANADLVSGRFVRLDDPLEARSLGERIWNAELAWELIQDHPIRGVGAGNYLATIRGQYADSVSVHSVPLLMAAELGLPGAGLWLVLMAAPFVLAWRRKETVGSSWAAEIVGLAPWVAMLVVSMVDTTVWLTTSWRAALLFGVLAGHVANDRFHE